MRLNIRLKIRTKSLKIQFKIVSLLVYLLCVDRKLVHLLCWVLFYSLVIQISVFFCL